MATIFDRYPLTRRRFLTTSAVAAGTVLGAGSLLEACGGGTTGSSSSPGVTLKYLNWNKSDVGAQVADLIKKFQAAHPNITIQVENIETNQYEQVLQTRLAAGDPPDIFASHGGTSFKQQVQAGWYVDLSDQSWVANMLPPVKKFASVNGKVYGQVIAQVVWGVLYNKQIFARVGLTVPTTWDEFLAACEKIKAVGITALVLGYKDQWTTQITPYTMVETAIGRDHPDFDDQMAAGKATFANSPWVNILEDTQLLYTKGYSNKGPNGTTYNQAVQMLAAGQAAMFIMGNWAVPSLLQGNPSLQLGMFPLPYKNPPYYLGGGPAQLIALSPKSKHVAEARQFLDFWGSDKVATDYVNATEQFPATTNVAAASNPIYADITPSLKNGTYSTWRWPNGVAQALMDGVQGLVAGTATVAKVIQNMDKAYKDNISSLPPPS